MAPDTRKAFINIMTSLVEKSQDPKLLKTLTKIVDEWVKGKVSDGWRWGRGRHSCGQVGEGEALFKVLDKWVRGKFGWEGEGGVEVNGGGEMIVDN